MKEEVMRKHMKERFGGQGNFNLEPALPQSLNVELNNTCNQKCVFCPYHGMYAPKRLKPAILDIEFVKRILNQAKSVGIGEKEVGFYMAGEAFLYPQLSDVVAYSKQLGFQYIFLTTNGALSYPEKLKAVVDAGLDSIRFSVNAADKNTYKELHGTDDFDKVLNNIKYLHQYRQEKKINIAISLSCVITKKTKGIQNEMFRIFGKYVDEILFIPVMLDRLDNIQKLRELYEVQNDDNAKINPDFICSMLFNTMYINAHGQVMPCCDAYDKNVFFANLKENIDLVKAWNSDGYKRYRKIFLEGESDVGTICENCLLRKKGVNRLSLDNKLPI